MKKLFYYSLLFVSIALLGCNASKNTSSSATSSDRQIQVTEGKMIDTNWSNLLRQVPGLSVSGVEPDISLNLRGSRTMQGDNQPLIVLDGVILGRNFGDLARAVLPREVESIRVLNTGQAARYGARGSNGVIEVKQKE